MKAEQLTYLAESLHQRICESRGTVGVYFDSVGVFRISPMTGIRYKQIQNSFPDSIIGVYNKNVSYDSFLEDFEFFCGQMGAFKNE